MQLGGAQRVVNNLMNYYCSLNYKVYLINDIAPDPKKEEYNLNNRVNRLFLDDKMISNSLRKNTYRIRRLRRVLKSISPDAIVSFLGPPNCRMLLATSGLHLRKIVSVRNDPYKEYGNALKRLISRILFRFADGCVFQTEEASNYFPKRVREKSKIILNPVNEVFFNTRWDEEWKEIAVVGRLQPQKNPLLAVKAFSLVAAKYPDFKMVFYGDDELKTEIVKKSIEYGIEKQVVINGKTQHVEEKLSKSTLYLLSSDYEGLPNALMEAMTVGIPVISTDCPCGGPRMLIQNSDQGILVPCNNYEALGQAIDIVLGDVELRKRMSENERRRSQAFRYDSIMRQWYDYILNKDSSSNQ